MTKVIARSTIESSIANQMTRSGYDKCKRNVLRCCLNIASDGADVTCGATWETVPEAGARNWKSRLPTVENLNGGTASWLVEAEMARQ